MIYILEIQHRTVLLLDRDGGIFFWGGAGGVGSGGPCNPPPYSDSTDIEKRTQDEINNIIYIVVTPEIFAPSAASARRLQSYSNNMTIQVDPV